MSAVIDNIGEQESSEGSAVVVQAPNRKLRLFAMSNRLSLRVHRLLHAFSAGIWLGLLDAKQVTEIVTESYDAVDLYHSQTHNLGGLFPWETEVVREYFNDRGSLVVAAAGGGREMIALARSGVQVDGFECNPGLVGKCREFLDLARVDGRIIQAQPDQVPSELGHYDGALVGCGALAHIAGRSKRVQFLKDLRVHLRPGSPVLVSVARRPPGSNYHRWIFKIARTIRKLRRSPDPIELGDHLLDCYTHQFVESELRSELEEAGLKVVFSTETNELHAVAEA